MPLLHAFTYALVQLLLEHPLFFQLTYHCVQYPVECLTELSGWLDPNPLLILVHPKITTDCDSNHTGISPLLD